MICRLTVMFAATLLAASSASAQSPSWEPANSSAGQQLLRGVWHAPQLGYVLDHSGRKPAVYQRTPSSCWRDKRLDALAQALPQRVRADGTDLRLSTAPTDTAAQAVPGIHLLKRLNALPQECSAAADTSPPAVLEAFAAMVAEHQVYLQQRTPN